MTMNANGIAIPLKSFLNVSVDAASDLDQSESPLQTRQTARVSMDCVVNSYDAQSPEKAVKDLESNAKASDAVNCPFTVKKRVFSNIMYQPDQSFEHGAELFASNVADGARPEPLKEKVNQLDLSSLANANQDVMNCFSKRSSQCNSRNSFKKEQLEYQMSPNKHGGLQSPMLSQKSHNRSECRTPNTGTSKRKRCRDKENQDHRELFQGQVKVLDQQSCQPEKSPKPDKSCRANKSNCKAETSKVQNLPQNKAGDYVNPKREGGREASFSPSKLEQFLQLDINAMKNPFVQRKRSDHFEIEIKKQMERSMPRTTSHFTQSAIYHKKSQQTDRAKRWSSANEHELSVMKQDKSVGLKLKLQEIKPSDDGFHEEVGIFEKSPSRPSPSDSPDNIVKRVMRKTSMSREIYKETYCRHLAQKITESIQTVSEPAVADRSASNQIGRLPDIMEQKQHLVPTNDLKIITEESQSHMGEEQVSSFQNQQSSIRDESMEKNSITTTGDRLRQSFENPPTIITKPEPDFEDDKKSMTFTELEMQINFIQKQDEEMKAQLDEIVVPEVPKANDMISGCSLNTEKIYQTYHKMLASRDTSACPTTTNDVQRSKSISEMVEAEAINGVAKSNAVATQRVQDYDQDELLKDSLDGASPSQREFIEHERQIENGLLEPEQTTMQVLDQDNGNQAKAYTSRSIKFIHKFNLNTSVQIPKNQISEDSPSPNHSAAAIHRLANKYSPNKKPPADHVQSCHLDEENFYLKEINKLKSELDNLKLVENELIQDQQQCNIIQTEEANEQEVAHPFIQDLSLVQEKLLNKVNLSKDELDSSQNDEENNLLANLDRTSDVGVGLFENKQEYEHVRSELDDESDRFQNESPSGKCLEEYAEELEQLNDNPNLLSSPSDSPPILRLQPSPITEMDNEYDSPVRTYRRDCTETNPLLTTENNDNIQNKMSSKIYFQDSLSSPPQKMQMLQKQESLNLRNLVSQIEVIDDQPIHVISTELTAIKLDVNQDQNSQGSSGQNAGEGVHEFRLQVFPIQVQKSSSPKEPNEEQLGDNYLSLPDSKRVQTATSGFENQLGPVELSSPCSFVLNPKKVQSSPPQVQSSKGQEETLNETAEPEQSPENYFNQEQARQDQPQTQGSASKQRASKKERTKRSQRKEQREEERAREDADDSRDHEISKKMRRSRKSRSGSATMTKMNKIIRNAKGSLNEQQLQKVNIEVLKRDHVEAQPKEVKTEHKEEPKAPTHAEMNIAVKSPDFTKEVKTEQRESQKAPPTDMNVMIKSPQTQYMFDKRFEMTEDSLSAHSNREQQVQEEMNERQNSFRLGIDGGLEDHHNSKSLKQSPTSRQQLLMNPQIIQSRNAACNKFKLINSNDVCKQDSSKQIDQTFGEAEKPWTPAEYNSLKSNTSRSSLYNRQLLKQQQEPVDEDCHDVSTKNQYQSVLSQGVKQPFTIASDMHEPTSPQILNLHQKNEKTEVELYDGSFVDLITTQRDSYRINNEQFTNRAIDHKGDDHASNDRSYQESARKATIMNAQSILAKTMQDSKDTKAQSISIAQSIKNKRKMNQSYLFGSKISSMTQQLYDTEPSTETYKKVDTASKITSKTSACKNNTQQMSDFSVKVQMPSNGQCHQRSQYCEELNVCNPFKEVPESQQSNSKLHNTQQLSSLLQTQQSIPAHSLKEYLNNTQQIDRRGKQLRNSQQRRFRASESQSNKANQDVCEMQRMTANIKKKMIDKYATQKNTHSITGYSSNSYYNTIQQKVQKQESGCFDRQSTSAKSNQDGDEGRSLNRHHCHYNRNYKSREHLPTVDDDSASAEDKKYFNRPEDLRSKSNSNIGRGLYQTKAGAEDNRSSVSLHQRGKSTKQVSSSYHQSAERRRAVNNNQQLNRTSYSGHFMKQSASVSHISHKGQAQQTTAPAQTYKNLAANSKKEQNEYTPTYCQPTSSFAQKKSVPMPQISYKQSRQPFGNNEESRSQLKTRNAAFNQAVQAGHKSSNSSAMFEKMIKTELNTQGYAKQFVFMNNNSNTQKQSCPSKSQKTTPMHSYKTNRHNFRQQTTSVSGSGTVSHCHGLSKTASYSTKFNMVRRSHIIQKQRDSPKKGDNDRQAFGGQQLNLSFNPGTQTEHALKMTGKRYSTGSNGATSGSHCQHHARRDVSHNFTKHR